MAPKADPYADFELMTSKGLVDVIQNDVVGLAVSRKAIIIAERQDDYEMLDTFIHEMLHISLPRASEKEVARISRDISKLLWSAGYRRIKR